MTLLPFSIFSVGIAGHGTPITVTVLVALLVCLIPTTIGGLLSAIGIAGMDRMIQANVIAMSGRAVEAAGDVDVLLLDKTGTITLGNRQAVEFMPVDGIAGERRWPTPRSSRRWPTKRPKAAASSCWPRRSTACASATSNQIHAKFIPFTAQTRISGVNMDGREIRKGAADAIENFVKQQGGAFPAAVPTRDRDDRQAGRHAAGRGREWQDAGRRFISRISSKAASRNASPNCGRWASRR